MKKYINKGLYDNYENEEYDDLDCYKEYSSYGNYVIYDTYKDRILYDDNTVDDEDILIKNYLRFR